MVSSGAAGASTRTEQLEPLVLERALDGAQPVRPLRMAERREVVEAGRVGNEEGGHRDPGICGRAET